MSINESLGNIPFLLILTLFLIPPGIKKCLQMNKHVVKFKRGGVLPFVQERRFVYER